MEIKSIEYFPGNESTYPLLVPTTEQTARGYAKDVRIGVDLEPELTPELEGQLRDELSLDVISRELDLGDQPHRRRSWAVGRVEAWPTIRSVRGSRRYETELTAALGQAVGIDAASFSGATLRGPVLGRVTHVRTAPGDTVTLGVGHVGLRDFDVEVPLAAGRQLQRGESILAPQLLWTSGPITLGRVEIQFRPEGPPPEPFDIWLPLMRLHCPRHNGCKANYKSEHNIESDVEVKLEIVGTGGGGRVVLTGKVGRDYTEEECVELVVPAKLRLQVGKVFIRGTELGHMIRSEVVEVQKDKQKLRVVPKENDDCQRRREEIDALPKIDALDQTEAPPGEYWHSITLKREVSATISVGTKSAGVVPFSFGLGYKRTSSVETIISTKLARGATYCAYAPAGYTGKPIEEHLEICWTTRAEGS